MLGKTASSIITINIFNMVQETHCDWQDWATIYLKGKDVKLDVGQQIAHPGQSNVAQVKVVELLPRLLRQYTQ